MEHFTIADRQWASVRELGRGGFGVVHEVVGPDGERAAVKVVPKTPKSEREHLAADLRDVRNVVPVLEIDETTTSYLLRMPLAETNLRSYLNARGSLPEPEAIAIVHDLATALDDLGRVLVHRDIKPENVLRLAGQWCLTDFGAARLVDASTDAITHKYTATLDYAPPEWWRHEHYEVEGDVYSLGVLAFELLTGTRPFPGPMPEDLRRQHATNAVPELSGVSPALADLIVQMMAKAPVRRPRPRKVLAALDRVTQPHSIPAPGATALQHANLAVTRHRDETQAAEAALAQAWAERLELAAFGLDQLDKIIENLRATILDNADHTKVVGDNLHLWFELSGAQLMFSLVDDVKELQWRKEMPFNVVLTAQIVVNVPAADPTGWSGRSHSLWFCDAVVLGEFAWYETAFVDQSKQTDWCPYASTVCEEVVEALTGELTPIRVAMPFSEVDPAEMTEFVDRWSGFFGTAVTGTLHRPDQPIEHDPTGSWRTS